MEDLEVEEEEETLPGEEETLTGEVLAGAEVPLGGGEDPLAAGEHDFTAEPLTDWLADAIGSDKDDNTEDGKTGEDPGHCFAEKSSAKFVLIPGAG